MSLETDIQNLTKAIEGLTAALTKAPVQLDLVATPDARAPELVKTEKTTEALETIEEPEVEQSEAPKTYKFEELQSACAALIQKDLDNKAKIKKVLDSFKAGILRDLNESDYADFMAQIGNI